MQFNLIDSYVVSILGDVRWSDVLMEFHQ